MVGLALCLALSPWPFMINAMYVPKLYEDQVGKEMIDPQPEERIGIFVIACRPTE